MGRVHVEFILPLDIIFNQKVILHESAPVVLMSSAKVFDKV